jgi:DNA-binding LacI/PurR family transcriptional regulator
MATTTRWTLRSLAEEIGVSKSAVSAALSGSGTLNAATREAICRAARERGFEPNPHAQRLSSGRFNNTIGIFALWLDFGVNTQKLQIIQAALLAQGYDVPIYGLGLCEPHLEDNQAAAIAAIRRQKPRALVCATGGLKDKAIAELEKFRDEGGILVSYDYPSMLDCDNVVFDREDNSYQSTRHLLELGHRAIGFAHHGFRQGESLRLKGYYRALEEFGVVPREDWILEGKEAANYAEGGVRLVEAFLELHERPTALTVVNDYAAMVAIAELQRNGLICPSDLSIVGHDDHAMSRHFTVPLTTVSNPAESIGEKVTSLLLERLNGQYDGPSRQETLAGELKIRQSAVSPQTA